MPKEDFSYKMGSWTFLDFVSTRGQNEIHDWLISNQVPSEAKAKINARIMTLQGFPIFPEQYFSAYTGWDDLYELKIVFSGVQYRPFGFYGPKRKEFCLLVGGVEKGKVPRSLLVIADRRREVVIANPNQTIPHDFS